MFSSNDKQYIIYLARKAIEHFLDTGEKLVLRDTSTEGEQQFASTHGVLLSHSEIPTVPSGIYAPTTGSLTEPRASFVTLTKDFELRGCIGSLEATKPLYLDIIDNATSAAFEDDRFFPVTKEELLEIEIEVSVLTKPMRLPVETLHATSLLDALTIGVDGVIIKRGNKSATYLPQVWDEILDKHDFMSSLCLKAGLEPDDWYKPGTLIWTYQVEIVT